MWIMYKIVGLPDLVRGLFETALGRINPPITVVNVLLHVAHIVEIEPPFCLFC